MTTFEYLIAFSSILAGLAVARLLHALPRVFIKEVFYITHAMLFISSLIGCIMLWWYSTSFKVVEEWNATLFLLYISLFIITYLQCDALASATPEKIDSWKIHYFNVRMKFWIYNLISWVFSALQHFTIFDRSWNDSGVVGSMGFWLVMTIFGIFSNKERTHFFISVSFILLTVMSFIFVIGQDAALIKM